MTCWVDSICFFEIFVQDSYYQLEKVHFLSFDTTVFIEIRLVLLEIK